jgi:peptide-methionine (S)-S-oxide reductase
MPGVIRTRVGYAGGTIADPTYRNIGDHTETVQIDYDPSRVSYEKLLEVFWTSHSPRSPSFSRQYADILFYHNEEQKQAALKFKAREATKGKVYTEIIPAGPFYIAEDYHQKYYLRGQRELLQEFQAIYPDAADLTDSTAAARINGFLAGYGTLDQLEAEIDSYGLSSGGKEKLLDILSRHWGEAVYQTCPLPGLDLDE